MDIQDRKISIEDQMFARMRADMDIGIQALIRELLNTGKKRGCLKLKLEIELPEILQAFHDECGRLHREGERCPCISYRIISKSEPIDRIGGIIPTPFYLYQKEDGTFSLK